MRSKGVNLNQHCEFWQNKCKWFNAMPPVFSKTGFTLAEVLITLGIIGVVTALTIPSLMTAYNKHITETRLKKFYSLFNQAIKLSVVVNDEYEGWSDYWAASGNSYNEDGSAIDQVENVDAAFDKYLAPHMKVMLKKHIRDEATNATKTLYILADGSAFAYRGIDTRDISFFPKNPEKCLKQKKQAGRCSFTFIFHPIEKSKLWQPHYGKGLEPYMYAWDGKKETLYNGTEYSCAQVGHYCTELIRQNGWKIPGDYPLKIQY